MCGPYETTGSDIPGLVHQLRQGSTDARRRLIEGFVGLAFSIAGEYKDDEALSAALYELVIAVDNFKESDAPASSFFNYVGEAIYRACINSVVRGRGKHRDKKFVPHHPQDFVNSDHQFTQKHHKLRWDGEVGALDKLDLLLGACEDDLERMMVIYAIRGYSQKEIAEHFKVGAATVCRRIRRIEIRFKVQERNLR